MTSSIDFCESNYTIIPFIAEFHNTWSSLLISAFGAIGMAQTNMLTNYSTFMSYFLLFAVGIGSALLHSTLHWVGQSLDELPMLWVASSILYTFGNAYYKCDYYVFLAAIGTQTIIYCIGRHIYSIFVITFCVYIGHIFLLLYLHPLRNSKKTLNKSIYIFIIGSCAWIIDMNYCNSLLPYYNCLPYPFTGITLHVVWHFCAGYAAYLLIKVISDICNDYVII